MKRFKIIILFLFTILNASAQDDLDNIFDDGDKDSKIFIGTNINTLATGTINAYGDFYPVDRFRISLGLGIIPFENYRNYSLALLSDGEIPSKFSNLSGGNFYSIGLAINSGLDMVIDFDYYYYAKFRSAKFDLLNDGFTVKQKIFSFGIGYLVGLPARFNLDIMAGMALGNFKINENFLDNTITQNSFGGGFELTFGINYAL